MSIKVLSFHNTGVSLRKGKTPGNPKIRGFWEGGSSAPVELSSVSLDALSLFVVPGAGPNQASVEAVTLYVIEGPAL